MIKMRVLAGGYDLSNYDVELLATDRLSFQHFLGYPEKIPVLSTVWLFRENLTNKVKIHRIWDELQRQLDEQGYSIKRGMIHDASFITSGSGHAKVETPRGDAATTLRSRDVTWTRKGKNQNLDTSFLHSSTKNTSSSKDSIHQLHHFMIARLFSRKKVNWYTGT